MANDPRRPYKITVTATVSVDVIPDETIRQAIDRALDHYAASDAHAFLGSVPTTKTPGRAHEPPTVTLGWRKVYAEEG